MKKKLGEDQTRSLSTNLIGCLLQCLKKKDAFMSHRPETILDNSFCLMKPSRASSPMTADAASLTTFIPRSTAWMWQGYRSSSRRVRMKPLISSSDNFIVSGGSENLAVFQSKSSVWLFALKLILGMTSFLIEVDLIAITSSKLKERRVSGSIFSFFGFLDFFPLLFFPCLFPTDLTAAVF